MLKSNRQIIQLIRVIVLLTAICSAPVAARPPKPTCAEDTVSEHAVVVLVDFTDKMDGAALTEVVHTQHDYRDKLAQGDRLTLYALRAPAENQDAALDKLFSACKPQSKETVNIWLQNPRKIEAQYKATWQDPLTDIGAALTRSNTVKAGNSPLLAVLKDIGISHEFRGKQRTLVVYSDLLEHTPLFSMYDASPHFGDLKAKGFASVNAEGLFQGTTVRITRLANAEHRTQQAPAVERFWQDYFAAAGVNETDIVMSNLDRQGSGKGGTRQVAAAK